MKVKPKKVEYIFCPTCGKYVKFKTDWEGVAQMTSKGVITYKELYAFCPECEEEVYVPAINDVNVYRRDKAFEHKHTTVGEELAKIVEDISTILPEWVPCGECIYSGECSYEANSDGCCAGTREEEEYEETV